MGDKSCYKLIVKIQAQDFERQYAPFYKQNSTWKRFYDFVFREPARLAIVILLTARHQLSLSKSELEGQDLVHMLNIERSLISSINSALQDPVRGISDHMLLAISLWSAYEIKHLNANHYQVHMTGLMNMINLRGGLSVVENHDPDLVKVLVRQDVKMSKIAGGEPFFEAAGKPKGIGLPVANPEMFRMNSRYQQPDGRRNY